MAKVAWNFTLQSTPETMPISTLQNRQIKMQLWI